MFYGNKILYTEHDSPCSCTTQFGDILRFILTNLRLIRKWGIYGMDPEQRIASL